MIVSILKEIIGLFVEDEFLALAILGVVAIAGALAFSAIPKAACGIVLVIALPLVLVMSVLRTLRRSARQPGWRPPSSDLEAGGGR
jgi:hypothetical protein